MDQPINQPIEQSLTETIYRLVRTIRRRPSGHPKEARGNRRLLRALSAHDGATAKELSRILDIRPASLAELLAKAEAQGLIRRIRDVADQRVILTYLEAPGHDAIKAMKTAAKDDEIYRGILSPEETDQLIHLCQKLTLGLEEKLQVSINPDQGAASDPLNDEVPLPSALDFDETQSGEGRT
ncbi:MAG: MarR family winged helix-turn-helix transcriptional regulator [Clostridiaceae bacterium]